MSAKFMKSAFVGWTFTAGVYYPPDFDATKLMPIKAIKPKGDKMMNIRMMFPFTMICDQCKEYNYTGTKFTSKVEMIKGESYLNLKVYRFYGRCRHCWSEFTFKTDPKNSDYTMESGGKRTYEAWKDADLMEHQMKAEKEKEAELDQMKALEQKAVDVQSEMQRLEDLDAIRTLNRRLGARDQTIEEALECVFQREAARLEAEAELPEIDVQELQGFHDAQDDQKRKLLDDEVENGTREAQGTGASSSSSSSSVPAKQPVMGSAILTAVAERAAAASSRTPSVGAKLSVKRKGQDTDSNDAKKICQTAVDEAPKASVTSAVQVEKESAAGTGMGLLGAYDSDESS